MKAHLVRVCEAHSHKGALSYHRATFDDELNQIVINLLLQVINGKLRNRDDYYLIHLQYRVAKGWSEVVPRPGLKPLANEPS